MTVEFRLLGHVEAAVDGTPLPIGYARLRCVLAVLLVEANHPVSVDHGLGMGPARRQPAGADPCGRGAAVEHYGRSVMSRRTGGSTCLEADTLVRLGEAYAGHARTMAVWHGALGLYRQRHRFGDERALESLMTTMDGARCRTVPSP